jgi:hypothetical protein
MLLDNSNIVRKGVGRRFAPNRGVNVLPRLAPCRAGLGSLTIESEL